MLAEPLVYVVDDDEDVRRALRALVHSADLNVETYASAEAFLENHRPERPGCLVLDLHMPGLSGLELQQRLTDNRIALPIIMLTGEGSVPAAVAALQGGAVDFMEKPAAPAELLKRIHQAIERDISRRKVLEERSGASQRLTALTAREREVMELVMTGSANKVIAIDLHISERTVELHRSRVMKKLGVRSVAELIHAVLSATAKTG
jgi:two-component system response regulator FixJ